jgi:copper chaperone
MQLQIETMACDGCAQTVTTAIRSVDAAARVTIDLDDRSVSVQSVASPAALQAALASAGYPARVAG